MIMLGGFFALLVKITLKEYQDFAYTESSSFMKKMKEHFDNLWNIIDFIFILSSWGFIIVDILNIFEAINTSNIGVKIYYCFFLMILFVK